MSVLQKIAVRAAATCRRRRSRRRLAELRRLPPQPHDALVCLCAGHRGGDGPHAEEQSHGRPLGRAQGADAGGCLTLLGGGRHQCCLRLPALHCDWQGASAHMGLLPPHPTLRHRRPNWPSCGESCWSRAAAAAAAAPALASTCRKVRCCVSRVCSACWGNAVLWEARSSAGRRSSRLTPPSPPPRPAFCSPAVGDARVGLVGFPSVGKSTLLTKVTGTFSEAAGYGEGGRAQRGRGRMHEWGVVPAARDLCLPPASSAASTRPTPLPLQSSPP